MATGIRVEMETRARQVWKLAMRRFGNWCGSIRKLARVDSETGLGRIGNWAGSIWRLAWVDVTGSRQWDKFAPPQL